MGLKILRTSRQCRFDSGLRHQIGGGKISTVSLTEKVLWEQFIPAPECLLNKPKGICLEGIRLWMTDIDVVWMFDLKTQKGRQVCEPETDSGIRARRYTVFP